MKKIIPILILSFSLISLGHIALAKSDELPSPGLTPDSLFYFMETIAEGIGNFFTFGDLDKAARHATLAAERVAEAKAVIEKGRPELAGKTLERYENQLNKSLARAEKAKAKGKNIEKIAETVAEAAGKQFLVLETILEKVPEQAKTAVAKAREASMNGQKNALRALARENPERAAEMILKAAEARLNRAKVKSEEGKINEVEEAVKEFEGYHELGGEVSQIAKELGKDMTTAEQLVERATTIHLEILAEIYEKVPERTKLTIEEAIKVSVKGYEQALEALQAKGVLDETPKEVPMPEKIPIKVRERIKAEVKDEIEREKLEEEQSIEVQKEIQAEVIQEKEPQKESSVKFSGCSRSFSPKFNAGPYYTGPLFDAHFHMPSVLELAGLEGHAAPDHPVLGKDITLDEILCFFDKENVRGAIAFNTLDDTRLDESVKAASDMQSQSSGKIRLFLMPTNLATEKLGEIQSSNRQLFEGYGEIALYDQSLQGVTPSSKKMQDIYDVAKKYGLVVMMHPDMGQKGDIEKALQNNPGVNFLLHGFESEDYATDLMDKYPNLYFSIDSAVLYPMMGLFMSGPKETFISRFEQDFNSILNDKLNKWKGKIKRHPDRFMWGTDRGMKWHFDEEISVLFEEFARAFIARLDSEVQENYAYKNAEKLLLK